MPDRFNPFLPQLAWRVNGYQTNKTALWRFYLVGESTVVAFAFSIRIADFSRFIVAVGLN